MIEKYQFECWALSTITQSKDLSDLFGADWRFATMSRLQRMEMSYVHKYRVGMISMDELSTKVAQALVVYRKELNPDRKLELHELAMAMGADGSYEARLLKVFA